MAGQSEQYQIVVVEDDPNLLKTIGEYLEGLGHTVRRAARTELAWQMLNDEPADVLLTDLRLPGGSGLDLLRDARTQFPGLVVLVMTGYASVASAVEAMRDGASDYLPKPFALPALKLTLERAIENRRLREENRRLKSELAEAKGYDTIIGTSPAMQRLFAMLDKICPVDSNVLIMGESGVGKELIVNALHRRHPQRNGGPLIPVHCGAIPETLIESELFGHARGAFTGADRDKPGRFEVAKGGTLFLDEIGTMKMDLQVKLLRALQHREVVRVGGTKAIPIDVRVVAATNEDLWAKVERGEFREDLFFRLNVIRLTVPPLRERLSDVPLLAAHFAAKYSHRNGLPTKDVSPETLRALMRFDWPGNVRELENTIEYATVMSGLRGTIEPEDLPAELNGKSAAAPGALTLTVDGLSIRSLVSDIERSLILQSLELTKGNKARAAQLLDLKRTTFVEKYKRIQRGLPTYSM